jgi:hypothetical protein
MNMARPHEDVSSRLLNKVKEYRDGVNLNNNTRIYNDKTYIEKFSDILKDLKSQMGSTNSHFSSNARKWHPEIDTLKKEYEKLYKFYSKISSDEQVINRVETNAARRALLYRGLTTALVLGLTTAVYSTVGNSDDMYLPLQSKTVTYYYDGKTHPVPPKDPAKYEKPRKVVTVTGSSKSTSIKSPAKTVKGI